MEIIPQAIDDARENAKRNHIENAEFFVGKAEEVLPEFYEKATTEASSDEMLHPDVIVVDPPRKGCDDACLNTMLRMQPGRIVYVSCDSATLARDLKILCDGGYEIRKVRGVDQFGMTVHVETVCLLSKVNLIQKNVEQLSENFISEKDVKNFVIYKGQKLEADIAYIEIYQQAKKSIYVVDDYMNAKSLQHLSQKADGVEVVLFTEKHKTAVDHDDRNYSVFVRCIVQY